MNLRRTLVLATVAHALLLVAIARPKRPSANESARGPTGEAVVEVDLQPAEVPPPPPAPELAKEVAASTEARARPSVSARGPSVAPAGEGATPEGSPESDGVVTAAPGSSSSPADPLAWVLRGPDLLARGTHYGLTPSPGPAGDPGMVSAGLTAHDHALGLGSGGPLLEAARDATSRSLAPVDGYAMFEALVAKSGEVSSVRVVDASSDTASWQDVATSIRDALQAKHLHVPKGANGLAIRLRVDSRWQMPDGSSPAPTKLCVVGFPCKVVPHGKAIVLSPLGIAGNLLPDSIGVKPLRVVHARVVEERAL